MTDPRLAPLDTSNPRRAALLKSKATDRLRDMGRHWTALRAAMGEFGDDFGLEEFRAAFGSSDPIKLNRVNAVERGIDRLYNYLAELVAYGLELAEERKVGDTPNAARDLRRLADLRVLSRERVAALHRLRQLRRLMVHEYTDATAEQVHQAALVVVAQLPAVQKAYLAWAKAGFQT